MLKSLKTKTIHYFRPFHYLPKITTVNILVCILIKKNIYFKSIIKKQTKTGYDNKAGFCKVRFPELWPSVPGLHLLISTCTWDRRRSYLAQVIRGQHLGSGDRLGVPSIHLSLLSPRSCNLAAGYTERKVTLPGRVPAAHPAKLVVAACQAPA